MSSATVATIACLALVGAVGMGVWVAVQQRRLDELARSLSTRKWDIVALRAELGALRRQTYGATTTAAVPGGLADAGADQPIRPNDTDGEPDPRSPDGVARTLPGPAPSPTAWRRDRARSASSQPRRRRRLF